MKPKKNPKANLEKRRVLNFNVGLIVALSLVLVSLEWSTLEGEISDAGIISIENFAEEDIIPHIPRERTKDPEVLRPKILVPSDFDEVDVDEIEIPEWDEFREKGYSFPNFPEIEEEEIVPVHTDLVQIPAEFPGGKEAMMNWIYNNIEYPLECVDHGISGRVYAKFTVDKFGYVTDIEISRSVHPLLDAEVVRVLEMMPKFRPAMQNQQLVPVFMYWPVEFRLN